MGRQPFHPDRHPASDMECQERRSGKDTEQYCPALGIQSGKIEMLFLHPDYFRKGIGRMLIQKAFSELDVQYVDVNEQNPSAVRFYGRMGFRTFRRDSTDDQGNPFPILRMKRL